MINNCIYMEYVQRFYRGNTTSLANPVLALTILSQGKNNIPFNPQQVIN